MRVGKLKTVLLVDDDDTTNFLNRFFLNQLDTNIKVLVAKNGQEALDLIQIESDILTPCLIVLDTNMPVMDGWDFLKAYGKQISDNLKKSIKIIMLPPTNTEEYKAKELADPNVEDVMDKPMSDIKFRLLITKYFA